MFAIYHGFSVDGGYGDAVYERELVAICYEEELAKQYVKEYSREHVYDTPYADLVCGGLYYEEVDIQILSANKKSQSPWDNPKFNEIPWARVVANDGNDWTHKDYLFNGERRN